MRNWLPLCFACFTAAVIAAPVQAQYIFMDVDGNQQCDAADIPPSGEGTIDVWLDTSRVLDGGPATCATGEELTISAYEVVLYTADLTVTGWTNARPEFPQSLGFLKEGNFTYVGHTSSGASTHLVPGLYKLGTIATTFERGCRYVAAVGSAILSGVNRSTGFYSQCSGLDGDNTIRLGVEFSDNCGTVGTICDEAEDQGTTWGKIKKQYLPK